jgi:hypothetical protein
MLPDNINVTAAKTSAASDKYLHRVLVAFDIFVNVIFRGRMDETISARSYRAALQGKLWGRILNGALNIIQKNHGALAAAGDLERATSIESTEKKVLQ